MNIQFSQPMNTIVAYQIYQALAMQHKAWGKCRKNSALATVFALRVQGLFTDQDLHESVTGELRYIALSTLYNGTSTTEHIQLLVNSIV